MNSFQPKISIKYPIIDILFLSYLITLVILLIMPTDGTVELNRFFLGIRTDHLIHASLFLPFLPYFRLKLKRKVTLKIFFQFYIAGVLFAVFCESLQLIVPYRTFDPTDILANLIGVTLGGLAFLWKYSPKKN